MISIHALRVEGDPSHSSYRLPNTAFLSTPSGWRATWLSTTRYGPKAISIHALRVEGDDTLPRLLPVAGISIHALRVEGDAKGGLHSVIVLTFLSTPSGWRATRNLQVNLQNLQFLSTPSGWRATWAINAQTTAKSKISIHALRVEGDEPPRTERVDDGVISIHALRVEGDPSRLPMHSRRRRISIHALRVEGDGGLG